MYPNQGIGWASPQYTGQIGWNQSGHGWFYGKREVMRYSALTAYVVAACIIHSILERMKFSLAI